MLPSLFLEYRWYAPEVCWWPSESWAAVSASRSPSVTSKVPPRWAVVSVLRPVRMEVGGGGLDEVGANVQPPLGVGSGVG